MHADGIHTIHITCVHVVHVYVHIHTYMTCDICIQL